MKIKKLLDPKTIFIDPIMTWPFVIGIRERAAGKEMDKKRWLNSSQQRSWEEGWDLMDKFMAMESDLKSHGLM